jgi:hypothetical protein
LKLALSEQKYPTSGFSDSYLKLFLLAKSSKSYCFNKASI